MHETKHSEIFLKDYRPSSYLIDSIELTFELNAETTKVTSKMSIRKNPDVVEAGSLHLNGKDLELVSIKRDQKALTEGEYFPDESGLTLNEPLPDTFVLEIVNRIHPAKNTELKGLYLSKNNFCTQCEPEGFRCITYFLDRPDVMARYKTTIIADEKAYPYLLSNGNQIEKKRLEGGLQKVSWIDPYKKPSYLFALVAGDFDCLEDSYKIGSGKKVALQVFVEKGNLDKSHHAMEALKKAMLWDEKVYGREYDLDLYMIVAVSSFSSGAMENKGLNLFNDKYILAKPETATDEDYLHIEAVVAHEYFHNWTGNRITCRDWFRLSLKEGLTIFREQSFVEDTTSKTVARIREVAHLRQVQFPEDAGPLSHPVQPESYIEINNFYTTTVYNKGAEVLRMIRTLIGEKLFSEGMDLYFSRYDGQAITIEDFVSVMKEASRQDFAQFDRWYTQPGTPTLQVKEAYDEKQKIYTLTLKQSCPSNFGQKIKEPFLIPIKTGLLLSNGKEIYQDVLQLKKETETISFPNVPEKPIASLLRGFSAPVHLVSDQTDAELLFLFKKDTDRFNRWQAGQTYFSKYIFGWMQERKKKLPEELIEAIREHLFNEKDLSLVSEMITLPTSKSLSDQMKVIDVEGIDEAREWMRQEIALELKAEFLEIYKKCHKQEAPYQFSMEEIGKRRLKNSCLNYLMQTPDPESKMLALNQFNDALARNMSDALPALICFANVDIPEREQVLHAFYEKWKNEHLVVDKWLAAQSASRLPDTLSTVKSLLKHPAFDVKVPNKVYALFGTFFLGNFIRYHDLSGSGYRFNADQVAHLDKVNPQVAAYLVKPLTQWRRFDDTRSLLMKEQLETIASTKLSSNVYELVSKALQ